MCCGGKCTGNCGGNAGGNFTYVRYASDNQGTNISKYIDKDNNGNIDGITRCYQSIFVSPIELDINSSLFPTHFTEWTYECEEECGCGGCEWFEYHRTELGNRWVWTESGLSNEETLTFQNEALSFNMVNGDVMTIPFLKDSDGNLLQSGLNYCFEFKFDTTLFTNPNSSVEISFGNGVGSTMISYNQSNISGIIKQTVTPVNGVISSHTMIIRLINSTTPPGTEVINFRIFNFRLAPENCCKNDCGCNCDINMKPQEIILGEEINFVHTDFGSEIDVIETGQTEFNRGVTQSIFNSAYEANYQPGSPYNTEWNSIFTDPTNYGFSNLTNIKERSYSDFASALDNSIGSNILGLELIMHDLSTDKYHKFLFSSWTSNGQGGGFSYARQEVEITDLCKITFSDGTVQDTAAANIEEGENVSFQESFISGKRYIVINSKNTWDLSTAAFVDPLNGSDISAVIGDGNKPYQNYNTAIQYSDLIVMKPGDYLSVYNIKSNKTVYCMPGVRFKSNSRFIDFDGFETNFKMIGDAIFDSNSYVFTIQNGSEVFCECHELNDTRAVSAFLNSGGNGGKLRLIVKNRIFVNCLNGSAIANYLDGENIELIIECPRIIFYHAFISGRTGDNNFVSVKCPDIKMLNGGPYGNIYKTLINNQGLDKNLVVNIDLCGGKYLSEQAVQSFSFGVADSCIALFVGQIIDNNHKIKYKNGEILSANLFGLNVTYAVSSGSIILENINLTCDNTQAINIPNSFLGAGAGRLELDIRNCKIKSRNKNVLGYNRKVVIINSEIEVVSDSICFENDSANPTANLCELYLLNSYIKLDNQPGVLLANFTGANSIFGALHSTSSEPIGTGTDIWSGLSVVTSLQITKN